MTAIEYKGTKTFNIYC